MVTVNKKCERACNCMIISNQEEGAQAYLQVPLLLGAKGISPEIPQDHASAHGKHTSQSRSITGYFSSQSFRSKEAAILFQYLLCIEFTASALTKTSIKVVIH